MKLQWKYCTCGHRSCKLMQPSIGQFYQGTGFKPEERELIDRAFAALEEKEMREEKDSLLGPN